MPRVSQASRSAEQRVEKRADPDEGVFSYIDPATSDIILEDVTHLRRNRTGKGEVAKGGGKVTYVRREDVKDVSVPTIVAALRHR